MTNPHRNGPDGPAPRRGFLASLSAALSPAVLPPDDGAPIVAPRSVRIGTLLAIISGALFMFTGGFGIASASDRLAQARLDYANQVGECTAQFGGIGTGAITGTSLTGATASCQNLIDMTEEAWSSASTFDLAIWVIFLVVGVAVVLGGWFLRLGRMWARRVLIATMIVTLVIAMLLGVSTMLILLAALLLMVAVVICYIGSGAVYFQRIRERAHG